MDRLKGSLPTCPPGSTTTSDSDCWVPHETTRGRHLRPYVGRSNPTDDGERFERLYIALYEPDGTDFAFFDVRSAPPKNARPGKNGDLFGANGREHPPQRLLAYGEFLEEVHHAYLQRNSAEFVWADGEEEPLAPDEFEPTDE